MAESAGRGGSDFGRPAIDWEQAFTFYASLPPERRSYQAVADRFDVSVRTVEKHGRQDKWKQRLAEINARVAAETNSSLSASRAEQIGKLVKLIDATLIAYADKLRRGDLRMSPSDLDRLHKLWQQLTDELTQPTDPPPANTDVGSVRTAEHTAEVINALCETGALEAFGLYAAEPTATDGEVAA